MRTQMKKALSIFLVLLPATLFGQQDTYYFHSIHTSTLAATLGRTYKAHYAYQLSRLRQLKLSGVYVSDKYEQEQDRITADVFNAAVQFQYNLIRFKKIFFSVGFCKNLSYHCFLTSTIPLCLNKRILFLKFI